jgi:hypothetical protein
MRSRPYMPCKERYKADWPKFATMPHEESEEVVVPMTAPDSKTGHREGPLLQQCVRTEVSDGACE